MTIQILIVISVLLLIGYAFDLTSNKTRIPSVILLLGLGYLAHWISDFFNLNLPDLSAYLPILGTIGLILIVLEGALELDLRRSTIPIIKKSFFMAVIPMLIIAFGLAYSFHTILGVGYKVSLTNAIPFCIISSAIAIPSVSNWTKKKKSFVIYESSLSDIVGVVFFNFIALNTQFNAGTFLHFFLNILIIVVISIVATVGLSFLLSRLNHHIKFGPILILIVLIYAVSKVYHLPALMFIMLFGLSIGNIDKFRENEWIKKLHPEKLIREVYQFREIVFEATFLARTLFFLLFGFLLKPSEILNSDTIVWALAIVGAIILVRAIMLFVLKLQVSPLMFIAPRGLITILLFFSITPQDSIIAVNKSLVVQVILLSVVAMMLGLIFSDQSKKSNVPEADKSVLDE